MLTVIITSFNEPRTIRRAVEAFLPQLAHHDELFVVAPDKATLDAVPTHPQVRTIQDAGTGKPAALNLVMQQASGDLALLTDGDVYIGEHALAALLAPFADPLVGAVSGHPISTNPRTTKLGYWSHLLTDAIHRMRVDRSERHVFFECSGYLMVIRKQFFQPLPEQTLGDDALISASVHQQGFQTMYVPSAEVYVKYPDNYRDWFIQKTRSIGAYLQPELQTEQRRMRSFTKELGQLSQLVSYPKTLQERWWTVELFIARGWVWFAAWFNVRVRRKSLKEIWLRVESSK